MCIILHGINSSLMSDSSILNGMTENVALKFAADHWNIVFTAPVWHPFPLKWHDVGIRLKENIHFP